jgi:hypothetical protein
MQTNGRGGHGRLRIPATLAAAWLVAALRDGGRMAIVEYYQGQMAAGHIRLDRDDAIREVERNGFRVVSRNDHIASQQYLPPLAKR